MNDGIEINEWACGFCYKHIGAGDPMVRVSYAIDRAGGKFLLEEPELLLGDEYCSPECAVQGTLKMLDRLKCHATVVRNFDEGRSG